MFCNDVQWRGSMEISPRDTKYFSIITELNKQHRVGEEAIFDCGKLGLVHIWWDSRWEHRWFEPSKEFLKQAST